ncbi:MAG: DUF349 domain-containing protein [Paludibacter sp.]
MNPLELNKDIEIVPNEPTEVVSPEINETEELTAEIDVVDSEETALETKTDEQLQKVVTKLPDYSLYTKAELVDALKLLIEKDIDTIKEEVEIIKQSFYKRTKAEAEESKHLFLEAGGEESEFKVDKDELEDTLKSLLNEYRSKKAVFTAQIEKDKENNLVLKQHILEQMKVLVERNDDVSTHINEFRALQQKWRSIGQVPAQHVTEMWKQYNSNQEAFWDLIKINNELREYDFKKNLEAKILLCEAAEKLDSETNIIVAFQQLQKLHEEWHELGPVSRELREQIWNRFKEASSVINKKHQAYFDTVRKLEDENMEAKIALCEKIEAFDYSNLNTYKAWDDATRIVLAWQDEWRTIGFAPRKVNQKLFDRYRKGCDAFFDAKAVFYKASKNILAQNLEKKKALCEQAEALKDSVEWKETSEKLIQLQKDWRTIGPVSKKLSDDLWKRFITACDYFFEQKNKNTSGQRSVETDNLAKKKEIIEKINLLENKGNSMEALSTLREFMAEWNAIGHVPFKDKDKVYKEYRTAVDKQFDILNIDASQRRLDSFKNNLRDMAGKGENKLYREREKLVRAYEHLKSEIATYENNIGFLSSSSKKGGGLIKEMERKIETLKEESKLIEQKINMIEEKM